MSMMPSNEVMKSALSRRAITLVYAPFFPLFVAFSTAWYLFYLLLFTWCQVVLILLETPLTRLACGSWMLM